MQLSVITYRFLRFEVAKQLSDRHRVQQRVADYAQDIEHTPIQSVVVLRDCDQAIRTNGSIDLDAHSILGMSPKLFDLQMLFQPFEKQLNLPPVLVQQSDVLCTNLPVVGKIDECPFVLLAVKADTSQFARVFLLGLIACQADVLIKKDVIIPVKHLLPINNLVKDIILLADDEIGLQRVDIVQSSPIIVSLVKDIVSMRLIRNLVHRFDIMHLSVCDVKECRDLSDYIKQGVYLDAPFVLAKSCPPKDTQTKIYRRRIKGIELTLQLKDTIDSLGLSKTHQMISKLFEDSVIAQLIRFGQVASSNWQVPKAEPLRLGFVGCTEQNHLSQTSATNQLRKHHHQQLIPTCKRTHVPVALVFIYNSVEHSVGQQIHQLPKHIFAHRRSNLKIRPIRSKNCANNLTEDFYYLNHCNIAC